MTDSQNEERRLSLDEQMRELLKRANVAWVSQSSGIDEERPRQDARRAKEEALRGLREFNLKPRDIRDYLDRFVVRQDEAKKALAVAICDHYNHVRLCLENPELEREERAKHNIVLLGPTGVGKTYLMRRIAKLINVPFVKADATKFSETGYVGHDVEDLVRDLVRAADGNVELARYGIIYLDEVDKIASAPATAGRDVSGRGVQTNMLKLMEETEVGLFSQTDLLGQIQAVMDMQRGKDPGPRTISTRHILFIVSGAFDRLADIVRRRVKSGHIGFASAGGQSDGFQESDWLKLAQTSDFVEYGFEPEFIGRLPVRIVCEPLGVKDLERILMCAEGNVLEQYKRDFAGYGIELKVDPDAIPLIAARAAEEKTGARGLMTVLERTLRHAKFELPSSPVRTLVLTPRMVEDPDGELVRILSDRDGAMRDTVRTEARLALEGMLKGAGVRVTFAPGALDRLAGMIIDSGKKPGEFCRERFKDLEYGVRLIVRSSGQPVFCVTSRLVEEPAEELSRRIAASARRQKQTEDRTGTSDGR